MSAKRTFPSFALALLVLAGAVAYVGFAGLDQGLRAARGEGTPGVFTAIALSCVQHPGHESCGCDGTFAGAGGGPDREVTLHGAGRDTCEVGAEIAAVDAGSDTRVYGPDGSREWIFSALLLAGAGAVALWSAVQAGRGVLAAGRSGATADRESLGEGRRESR
ncbi:hypothetical protein DFP74_0712 [Nocardiopsis sp. Huas11]|uniref:hypothetical protein n=1 Tax=Nocardiopsis sp. Huas11 TaxID=2183912 RepID=UPI000F216D63|nr:hypothetical protein [Nocardiopsis sp. Huas11]RKS05121.1 hypothetical protein DFP74_0712 [Nocardiopsis sp. Huas11]